MKKKTLYIWTVVIMLSGICLLHVQTFIGASVIVLLTCIAEFVLLLLHSRKQDKNLEELEVYCEKVLNNRYALDLRDNEEGELSIVKNKVYDITVMLNEKNRCLQKQKEDIERLLADISHQLKTPITSLHMINELLYLDLPQEKKMEFLDNMQKDLMRIEWFVKNILNLAKLDSHTLVLQKKMVDAEELSREVKEYFQIFCDVNGSEIHISGAEQVKVLCDKKWTKEAINNIVKNAIEHGAKNVQLDWEENYLYTKLEIKDDGEGIAKEELPHMFERFYKTKSSKEDSIGLGLAFCKSIIEYQDGEIKVRSREGEGTMFLIKLYKNDL